MLDLLSLFGLPLDDLPELIAWKDALVRPTVVAGSVEAGLALQAKTARQVYERFAVEMEARRSDPRNDLISEILVAEVDGRRLTDNEISRILFLLLVAGLDTVTVSLECIFNHLLTHPEHREMLVAEPDSVDNFIEELLRWETPVQNAQARRVTRDTELSGCPIAKDTLVLPMLAAANLDPDVAGSGAVDVRHGDKRHLAFGGGPHRCLGSHLARMEMRVVLREWHARIPEYSLRPGTAVEWNGSSPRGIDYLPLVWKRG